MIVISTPFFIRQPYSLPRPLKTRKNHSSFDKEGERRHFIQFRIKIDDGFLAYQILFLTIPIYKRVVYPNQIIQMKFKRVGWATKGVVIQVNKGFNIRVVNFVPNNVYINLINFANKYGIPISKTRDYLILEK